ncbi:MAG: hypothetical protein LC730_02030 [Acidobacteria bacterium]|nr:hypothetical protein [Acidobacteriota bacterium]MCA1608220.1 hypothetical protein [Acidobacteriota bacterium]
MSQEKNDDVTNERTDGISGFGQKMIGKIETIGGVLTGDPTTQAEGEFNVEVGTVREEIEEDREEVHRQDAETPREEK